MTIDQRIRSFFLQFEAHVFLLTHEPHILAQGRASHINLRLQLTLITHQDNRIVEQPPQKCVGSAGSGNTGCDDGRILCFFVGWLLPLLQFLQWLQYRFPKPADSGRNVAKAQSDSTPTKQVAS